MELRVLRYFLTVAREETVSRAAELLHITQPTLSRQLAQMEYELGTTLFEHRGRRIVLTADGLLLRRRAEEILELVDRAEQEMSHSGEELQGVIVAGHGETAAMRRLADCVAAFHQEHPLVRFSFFSGTADVVKERMDRGLIDVGLLMEPIELEKYDYIRMEQTERLAAFMPPDDPLSEKESILPEDLAGKPLILPTRYQNMMQNWMGHLFREDNVHFLTNLPTMGGIMAAKGLGYLLTIEGVLPFRDLDKLAMRPLKDCEALHSVLAWKRGQPASPAVERFIQFAKCFWGIDQST